MGVELGGCARYTDELSNGIAVVNRGEGRGSWLDWIGGYCKYIIEASERYIVFLAR